MLGLGGVGARGARPGPCRLRLGSALMLLAVAGCTAAGQAPAILGDARGTAVALDSIDGPPAQVLRKLAHDLNEEASARQIAVVAAG